MQAARLESSFPEESQSPKRSFSHLTSVGYELKIEKLLNISINLGLYTAVAGVMKYSSSNEETNFPILEVDVPMAAETAVSYLLGAIELIRETRKQANPKIIKVGKSITLTHN